MVYSGAVDIGGTKILVGIVDSKSAVICSESFPTPIGRGAASNACSNIITIIQNMENKYGVKISKLGIVSAGPVDCVLGTIENPFTLSGWEGFNIVDYLSLALLVKVKLENDVNGAILGEIRKNKLIDKSVLMVAIGTGIGAAFYDGKKLYKTSGRFHPELGHQIVDIEGEECYCKNRGCFESLCSGTAMNKRSKAIGYDNFSILYDEFAQGKKELENFIKKIELQYRNGFWNLLTVFKPEIFILSGGFALANEKFLRGIFEKYFCSFEEFIGSPKLIFSEKSGNTALIGASMIFDE